MGVRVGRGGRKGVMGRKGKEEVGGDVKEKLESEGKAKRSGEMEEQEKCTDK